jgi:hypothetical protein
MAFRRCKLPVVSEPVADEPVADEPDFALALEEARRNLDSLNSRLTDLRTVHSN